MAYYNPMLVELQTKIREYNKDVHNKIEDVAKWQNIITASTVLFNLLVLFLSNHFLPDDSNDATKRLLPFITNGQVSILITVATVAITVPFSSLWGKKRFNDLKLNENVIKPSMQYAGSWEYHTSFRIQSPNDGTAEYKRFENNMKEYEEHGLSEWTQNVFELKIDFANTTPEKEQPKVTWRSNPISYDEHEISWSFGGKIWWKDDLNYANEFSGIEQYTVKDHDSLGRPSRLEGHLIGTILVGQHFYVVDAISNFTRR